MCTIKFKEYGRSLGTRNMGADIRKKIKNNYTENQKVILDFEGVNSLSNSFTDECIGKLILEDGIDKVKKHTTFKNVNKDVRLVLNKVINDSLKK